ncbi:hypothetical protein RE428_20830 [Marinobacter nanhaiticus D15-8W]|uniref:DUF4124 domain-containing protein n=1 Tax=Marinobacter nanhaiticus D15-8W TaxID=626887 RepID=N6WY48_9GAMM|nr:MalM family protein [Marinobacter nanhaiticus]ENO13693.1 hypothetical protein J057_19895 [Marinobacter nanhaiticus D15-8W]BES71065.1 hypothetical protein RE428_20830 [Marinobacter nanhaiticus D15-8W]
MKLYTIVVSRLLVLLLSCVLVLAACSTGGGAEGDRRYFTWVDEFGRVRQSPIKEEKNPVEQRAKQVRAGQRTPAKSRPVEPEAAQDPTSTRAMDQASDPVTDLQIRSHALSNKKAEGTLEAESDVAKPAVLDAQATLPPQTAPSYNTSKDTPADASPGSLPAFVAAEKASTKNKASRAAELDIKEARPGAEPSKKPSPERARNDESEYTLENYPDGNELAKKGFIREGDPLPYFTWRDAQGNTRVDYYRPEAGFDNPKQDRSVTELTSALVIDGSRQPTIEQANPAALEVLGIDKTESLLEAWVRQCCEDLPRKDLAEWDDSREFQLDLDDLAPEFRFSTGNSAYRLVELPEPENSVAFVMQVRSYVKQGVFLPTLVFLDKDMATRRLVTELAFEYQPESWHSHGYLEARVPAFPRQGDRWLLIMSRAEDQAGQTVFETEEGTTVIRHSTHGLLGLAELGG